MDSSDLDEFDGLVFRHITDSAGDGHNESKYPVLQMGRYTYWGRSFLI